MKLDIKAVAVSAALTWGVLCMFGVGVINLKYPSYGQAMLDLAASIYPGYDAGASLGQVLIGSAYGLVDGAVGGAIFAWLYNRFVSGAAARS